MDFTFFDTRGCEFIRKVFMGRITGCCQQTHMSSRYFPGEMCTVEFIQSNGVYHLGSTTGNINDINYLECPY